MGTSGFTYIGKDRRRMEDPRLLVGRGGYIADLAVPGMLHTAILRSPLPHARIGSVDAAEALELPGVVAVFTGADCKAKMDPCVNFGPPTIAQYPLAVDKVRYVGEAVAAVIAESRYLAEDGVDLLKVDYDPLPPVTDPMTAMAPEAALLHEEHGSNIGFERTFEFGDVTAAFAGADLLVEDTLRWGRCAGMPLETTGALARPGFNGVLEIFCNSLNFTYLTFLIAAALRVPSNKLTMKPVPAGGSFGSKAIAHKVPTLAGFLALRLSRPVSYIEDRTDHLMNSDSHGSDRIYEARMGFRADGTIVGLDIDVVDDYGAYLQLGVGQHGNAFSQIVGPYRFRDVRYRLRAVLTNKCQQSVYRGAGSEVQNWVLERLVDQGADRLGLAPEEIRRRNFIQPHQFPYKIPGGNLYDSGDYPAVLDKALSMIDLDRWRAEQRRLRREEGRHVGIGLATVQERSVYSATEFWALMEKPAFPITSTPESATVTIDPIGQFQLLLHCQSMWGNSPETVGATLLAEEFGISPESVNVQYADSSHALPSTGPGGSRYTAMVAGAIRGASRKLREKLIRIAAHTLGVAEDDLELVEARVQVRDSPETGLTIAELAGTAYFFALNLPEGMTSGLEESYTYDHPYTTLPAPDGSDLGVFYPIMGHACHIAIMEVDPDTGIPSFLDYVAVHDAGTIVNPRSLGGHITGGAAQGIGTALYEELAYDEEGRFRSPTLREYLIPTADEIPAFRVGHVQTPSPFTEYGIKGGGEGGRMVAPAAVSAAIDDALREYGMRVRRLPVRPSEIVATVLAGHAARH
ncbi:xanthine dehydrogenase family protein molybdopterin-binding subunit [Streptomyces sp. NPDC001714]|uniref:xanthine dehydrogenase family protein molybdopterin-binding subunit n=1 Tax=Streptomyces sp. NPDC001714 TaxID=3364603 RepID=UPI0036C2731B